MNRLPPAPSVCPRGSQSMFASLLYNGGLRHFLRHSLACQAHRASCSLNENPAPAHISHPVSAAKTRCRGPDSGSRVSIIRMKRVCGCRGQSEDGARNPSLVRGLWQQQFYSALNLIPLVTAYFLLKVPKMSEAHSTVTWSKPFRVAAALVLWISIPVKIR